MKSKRIASVAVLSGLLVAGTAYAATNVTGDESSAMINSTEVYYGSAQESGDRSSVEQPRITNDSAQSRSVDSTSKRTLVGIAILGVLVSIISVFSGTKTISFGLGARTLIGMLLFVGLLVVGMKAPHREKTHSGVFCALFTVAVSFMTGSRDCAGVFCAGYTSHLIIDLFNKKGECLFWPWKRKTCLDLCSSDGIVNKCLGALGTAVVIFDFVYFVA